MGTPDRGEDREIHAKLEPRVREGADSSGELIPAPPADHEISRRTALRTAPARLFASSDPAAILARIANGDPLRLFELGARRVRERFLFIDLERLYELSLAFVARTAAVERRNDADEAWLTSLVERAIDSILTEDSEEQRAQAAPNDPEDPRYKIFAVTLGVDPALTRSAVVNFNGLAERARKGFFRLLIENREVQETLAEGHWREPHDLRLDIWDGLRALGHLREGEVVGQYKRSRR